MCNGSNVICNSHLHSPFFLSSPPLQPPPLSPSSSHRQFSIFPFDPLLHCIHLFFWSSDPGTHSPEFADAPPVCPSVTMTRVPGLPPSHWRQLCVCPFFSSRKVQTCLASRLAAVTPLFILTHQGSSVHLSVQTPKRYSGREEKGVCLSSFAFAIMINTSRIRSSLDYDSSTNRIVIHSCLS